jgi:hypothetical protein
MKTVRGLSGVLIIVALIYVLWSMIPAYYSNYKLEDFVTNEARTDTYNNKTEDEIRDTILQKAQQSEIPLTKEQISVQRGGNTVAIEVNYTVHLNFPIHPVDLKFQATSKNKGY